MYSQAKINRIINDLKALKDEEYTAQIKAMEEKIIVLETTNKELESKLTAVETKVEAIDAKPEPVKAG